MSSLPISNKKPTKYHIKGILEEFGFKMRKELFQNK